MKKILFLALAALATLQASAQWRIGVNVGGMYNHYVIDKHYFDDYQYKDRWGVGFGLMGQYDILFGGTKLRGFCHVGAYGGYWLNSRIKGDVFSSFSRKTYDVDQEIPFDSERDQRWDFGFLGGLGMEYRFASHWAAQVEMRYYHSVVSTQKDYMRVKDPKYNSTLALQAGVCYFF